MRHVTRSGHSGRPVLACGTVVLAFVLAFALAPASSAAPPATQTVTKSGTLLTANQNPFGTGGAPAPGDKTFSLFDVNWNASGSGGGITNVDWHIGFDPTPDLCPGVPVDCDPYHGDDDGITIPVGDFGATGSGSTQGEIGMSLGVNNFSGGSVGINYPVDAHFVQPAQDTFAPGATVAIDTSASADPSGSIQTTFPTASSVSLDGKFGFHADASANLCVFSCFGGSLFNLSIPDNGGYTGPASGNIFTLNTPGTTCFNFVVNFIAGFGPYPNSRCNNNGYLATPNRIRSISDLVVQPSIRVPADLRGKRIGVNSLSGTVYTRTITVLDRLGLEPTRDNITIQAVGDEPTLAQAPSTVSVLACSIVGAYSYSSAPASNSPS